MVSPEIAQAYRKFRDTRTFGSLNGVRGLCILAVVWHHVPSRVSGNFSSEVSSALICFSYSADF